MPSYTNAAYFGYQPSLTLRNQWKKPKYLLANKLKIVNSNSARKPLSNYRWVNPNIANVQKNKIQQDSDQNNAPVSKQQISIDKDTIVETVPCNDQPMAEKLATTQVVAQQKVETQENTLSETSESDQDKEPKEIQESPTTTTSERIISKNKYLVEYHTAKPLGASRMSPRRLLKLAEDEIRENLRVITMNIRRIKSSLVEKSSRRSVFNQNL